MIVVWTRYRAYKDLQRSKVLQTARVQIYHKHIQTAGNGTPHDGAILLHLLAVSHSQKSQILKNFPTWVAWYLLSNHAL